VVKRHIHRDVKGDGDIYVSVLNSGGEEVNKVEQLNVKGSAED
jgi:hypothetical protein